MSSMLIEAQEIDLNENLLVHYPFDGNTHDVSKNGFHGVGLGEVEYFTDRFGQETKAIAFDGIDDFILLPNLDDLKPELPVTISFDIKYESDDVTKRVVFNTSYEEDYNTGVFFTSQASTGNYALGFGDGDYNYTSSSRRSFIGDTAIENDKWLFLTIVVRSSTDMSIYVDGVEIGGEYSGTGGSLSYSTTSGVIGKHDQSNALEGYYFQGMMNDFKYWDKALTEEEVEFLYNSYIDQQTLSTNYDLTLDQEMEFVIKDSKVYIDTNQKIMNVEVFSILGEKLYSSNFSNELDLNIFPSGLLILKAENNLGDVFVKKIIK